MSNEQKPAGGSVGLHPIVGRVTLTGHELKAALEFLAPDGDPGQLDQTLVIEWWDAAVGRNEEAGYYAWHAEYPDEGCIMLEPNASLQPAARSADRLQGDVGQNGG